MLALVLGWDRDRPRLTRWLRWLQWPLYAAIVWVFSQQHLGHGTSGIAPGTSSGSGCAESARMVAVWGKGWLRAALSYSRIVWLGKISYGLYMYHEIALWIAQADLSRLPWFANKEELFAIATLALTIALAAASYYGYERRFLLLKRPGRGFPRGRNEPSTARKWLAARDSDCSSVWQAS